MGAGASNQQKFQAVLIDGADLSTLKELSDEDQAKMLELCRKAAQALWKPQVLTGDKYKPAWNLLRLDEQKALETILMTFKIEVHKLQGVLTDWLFDEKNWIDDGDYGKSVTGAMYKEKWAASREPVLQLFRKIRSTEAIAIMEMVDTLVERLYSEIDGTPGPVTNTTKEGEAVYQTVPEMFEGESGDTVFKFTECPEEIQNVFKEAALLIKNGYEPCGPGFDDGVNFVETAEETNEVYYSTYIVAQGIVIQEEFHQEVAKTVANVPNATFRPAPHKKYERFNGKATEYRNEGVPMPAYRAVKDGVRCSVICNDHASLINAHNALLASPLFEGKITKDRREERSCRDILQVVLFKGFLCEVQFHFKSTLPLKVFSHAAYNIKRPEDQDLNGLKTIFEMPQIDMQNESRDNVSCNLHF